MHRLRWPSIAGVVLLSGCLLSSTRVFEFDVIGNANLPAPLHVTDAEPGEARVELIRARTYEESRGDIQVVDRAGFAASLRNRGGAPASLSLYLSDQPGLTDPAADAVRLLSIAVPPEGREWSFEDSEKDLENLAALRDAIEFGEFHLYLHAAAGSDLDVERLLLVVSMTVEP